MKTLTILFSAALLSVNLSFAFPDPATPVKKVPIAKTTAKPPVKPVGRKVRPHATVPGNQPQTVARVMR